MENVSHLLSLITFIPLLGAGIILFINRECPETLRWVTIVCMLIDFVLSLFVYFGFDSSIATMQFVERYPWIPQWGISYKVGIDGISLLLLMLTTFLGPILVLACWKDITVRVKEFMICLLFLQVGMIGVFVSLDLFLF